MYLLDKVNVYVCEHVRWSHWKHLVKSSKSTQVSCRPDGTEAEGFPVTGSILAVSGKSKTKIQILLKAEKV